MGGRGSSFKGGGGSTTATSNKIKNEMLKSGLNSKFKGVQRDAKAGAGNFSYKDAKAIDGASALKMEVFRVHEKNGNTLIEGLLNGKHVFYANTNSDKVIQSIQNNIAREKERQVNSSRERPEIRTTSTYDRWKKKHKNNFDSWFYGTK